MNKIWFSLLASLALCMPAFGQSFIQNTMFDYNRFVYNPATAGLGDKGTNQGWSINALGRLQWAGIDGAPQLVSLSGHRNFDGFGSLGGYIMQDELGPLSSTSINVSYALPLEVGSGHLSFGVSTGFSQRAINQSIIAIRPDDPVFNGLTDLSASTGVFNLSAGAFYQSQKFGYQQFFVGLSGQDLLEPSIDALKIDPTSGGVSNVPRSFYLTSGYRFPMGVWTPGTYNYLQPTVMLRLQGSVVQSDISLLTKVSALRAGINYRGLWYTGNERGSESIGGILGFDLSEELFFGYSYDLNLSSLNSNGDASSHELVLTFNLAGQDAKPRKSGTPVKNDPNATNYVGSVNVDEKGNPVKAQVGPTKEEKKAAKASDKKVKPSKEEKKAAKETAKQAKEAEKARKARMTSAQKRKAKEVEKANKKKEKEAKKAAKNEEKADKKARKQFKAKKKKAQKK
ncbi:MAG: PorP/SprF family type IX secretion system membrane protein [Bacteroidia bacterium]